jgi:hypothetical protein
MSVKQTGVMSAATVLFFVWTAAAWAGWEYAAVSRGEGSEQAAQANTTIKGWVEGDRAKIEFQASENPMMPAGTYLITSDGGRTLYMVNPEQKSYSKWDMDAMMGFAGGAMKMLGVAFSQPKIEKLAEEKGPSLFGLSTRYYRFRTTYTMTMNFMGMKRSTETTQEEETWATEQLADPGFKAWLNQKPAKTGNAELDKLMEAEIGKMVKGFPLKKITSVTQKDSDGKVQTQKATMEVTSLSKRDVPATAFELPQGYTEQPMFPGLASGAQEGGDEEEDDDAKAPSRKQGSNADNPFLKFMQQMQKQQR